MMMMMMMKQMDRIAVLTRDKNRNVTMIILAGRFKQALLAMRAYDADVSTGNLSSTVKTKWASLVEADW